MSCDSIEIDMSKLSRASSCGKVVNHSDFDATKAVDNAGARSREDFVNKATSMLNKAMHNLTKRTP